MFQEQLQAHGMGSRKRGKGKGAELRKRVTGRADTWRKRWSQIKEHGERSGKERRSGSRKGWYRREKRKIIETGRKEWDQSGRPARKWEQGRGEGRKARWGKKIGQAATLRGPAPHFNTTRPRPT